MIITTKEGNRHLSGRATVEWGSSAVPRPSDVAGYGSYSGSLVSPDTVTGLAAWIACIRGASEIISSLPIVVYRGTGGSRQLAGDAWQLPLLSAQPNLEQSPMDLLSDVSAGVEGYGNAVVQKFKSKRGRVGELMVVDPDYVRIRRDRNTKEKVFDVYQDGATKTYTSSDFLHVRGFSPRGGVIGMNPIQAHRHALGTAIALEEFEGRFFANDATPPFALKVPGKISRQDAEEMLAIWTDTHGGLANAHKPAIVSNGADVERLGVSLRDAVFVESMKFSEQKVCWICRYPPEQLGVVMQRGVGATTEEESLRLLVFYLYPRLRRIEMAFRSDQDLFPPDRPEYPEFLVRDLLRADTSTQATADSSDVQAGIMLVDEIRAQRGLPPLPNGLGQIPQITPVGGAPNPPPHDGGMQQVEPAGDPGQDSDYSRTLWAAGALVARATLLEIERLNRRPALAA